MTPLFVRCLNIIFELEGGYANDPADNGGPTNYGITQETYDDHLRREGAPLRPVRDITLDEARQIYHRGYWQSIQGDALPPALALAAFNAHVQSGGAGRRCLQRAIGGLVVDGIIGPKTVLAARGRSGLLTATRLIQLQLETIYTVHEDWPRFGRTWSRRCGRIMVEVVFLDGLDSL